MYKKLLLILPCALALCLLLVSAACADNDSTEYAGEDHQYSYWVLARPANSYGVENNYDPTVGRFSIYYCTEFKDDLFTTDYSKWSFSDGPTKEGVLACVGNEPCWCYRSGDEDCGFKFISNGKGKYYICTTDGHYIKRKGGMTAVNKPYISSTTDQSTATAFSVVPTGEGNYQEGYLIYEEGDIAFALLNSYWDSDLNTYRLRLSYYPKAQYDIQNLPYTNLFRRSYSAYAYLQTPKVSNGVDDSVLRYGITGPYSPTGVSDITFPCFFSNGATGCGTALPRSSKMGPPLSSLQLRVAGSESSTS